MGPRANQFIISTLAASNTNSKCFITPICNAILYDYRCTDIQILSAPANICLYAHVCMSFTVEQKLNKLSVVPRCFWFHVCYCTQTVGGRKHQQSAAQQMSLVPMMKHYETFRGFLYDLVWHSLSKPNPRRQRERFFTDSHCMDSLCKIWIQWLRGVECEELGPWLVLCVLFKCVCEREREKDRRRKTEGR